MTRPDGDTSEADRSPVTLPPDSVDHVHPLRWATGVIVVATAVLALTNAHALGGWFDELPPGPLTEPLRQPVEAWRGNTAALGLDRPRAFLNRTWRRAQAARFGSEAPAEEGE